MTKEDLTKVCTIIGNNCQDRWNEKAMTVKEALVNCIKLKLCTTPESKKIEKMIAKIKTDFDNAGITVGIPTIAYSFVKNNNHVSQLENGRNIKTELGSRKNGIDQRPLLDLKMENEQRVLSWTKNKKEAGESQKKIKEYQKEIDKLVKSNTYYQTSNDFKTMIRYATSDDKIKKLPGYIKFDGQELYMEEQDRYDDEHGGYSLYIKKLTKEKLKDIMAKKKENKYYGGGDIEKYNNNVFIVKIEEHESTPKDFVLKSVDFFKLQLDKIPEYKSLIGLNKKLESTADMSI